MSKPFVLADGHRKATFKPENKNSMKVFHLKRITEKGNLEYTQGMNSMPGTISKKSIPYYLERFTWSDREKIEKHFGEEK